MTSVVLAIFACVVMILTAFSAAILPGVGTVEKTSTSASSKVVQSVSAQGPVDLSFLRTAALVAVHDTEPGVGAAGATYLGPDTVRSMSVLMTLAYSNQGQLNTLLAALSNPSSPLYHHYLTASQFISEFSPSPSAYDLVQAYLSSFEISNLTTFADRTTISFDASSSVVEAMFHTEISSFRLGSVVYYAPSSPLELPAPIASTVSAVEGLSSYQTAMAFSASQLGPIHSQHQVPVTLRPATGYLAPATYNGAQLEYGPDLQIAYDEESLFAQYGYPTDEVVATILWSGTYAGGGTGICASLTTGTALGPFVPADIYDYYNETMPTGEPHPHIQGVPVNGAPPAGKTASCGDSLENTLDLEMVGSLAPGSSIYNVYGPTSSFANIDLSFATILSPGAGDPTALDNVSVISNSWGAPEWNDTSWYQYLEQAQARGITVLACSGDSGDDPNTTWTVGDTFTPAAMAYNSFGDTAVGGTTITLDPTSGTASFLAVTDNIAWYDPPIHWGSSGGISTIFPEPSWQLSSLANSVIKGAGRGDPDLGAIANNTLVTWSEDGYQYIATNASGTGSFEWAYGTSIATPVEAGIVAEMDHVLKKNSQGPVGYLNPDLYRLADMQYSPCLYAVTATTGCYVAGSENTTLPTFPLIDSSVGGNYAYSALVGYDLVTGMGSMDAYNYTMYFLTVNSAGILGRFSAVDNVLNMTKLKVTSAGVSYNASFQQNFFLANSLGAPVYWVQNVIYLIFTTKGWEMNFTGWVVYPFYGIYPSATCYAYNWPLTGAIVPTPFSLNLSTTLSQGTGFSNQYVTFAFGYGQPSITLPVPGASYIIGSLWYNYSWQGATYSNGPFPDNLVPGGLSPQFGLVGGPSGGNGTYGTGTAGTMYSTVEPWGTTQFISAATKKITPNLDQTGEDATNLGWTYNGRMGSWTIGYSSGSHTQGVLSYDPRTTAGYAIYFNETGLPTGTPWSVTLGGVSYPTSASSDVFYEPNGVYPYTIGAVSGYSASPSSGSVTVSGSSPAPVLITFTPAITLTSVAISPSSAIVSTGGAQAFTATPKCGVTSCPSGTTFQWALTSTTLGSITASSGNTTTFNAGTATGTVGLFVNATLNGTIKMSSAIITVMTIALESVAVTPTTPTVISNGVQAFVATPKCSTTCPLNINYAWTLSSSTLGSITPTTGSMVNFTALSIAGTVGIFVNATLGATTQESFTEITVSTTAPTLTSVVINPAAPIVSASGTQVFNATPTCSSTCPTSGITYVWTLTSSTLGSISPATTISTTFTAGSVAGTVGLYVNATLYGLTQMSSAVITVTTSAPTLNSVSVTPSTPSVVSGGTLVLTANPTCSTTTCPSGITYTWTLTNTAMGSITPTTGSPTTFTAGTTLGGVGIFVNASLGATTQKGSTLITITSSTPTLNLVTLSPTSATVYTGDTQAFTATASCSTTCPSGTTYSWTLTNSAKGMISGTSSSVTFTAGSTAGTVGLYVNATLNGVTKGTSAVITIEFSPVSLISLALSPISVSMNTGDTQVFTATPTCSISCPTSISYAWALTSTLGTLSNFATNTATFTAGSATGTLTLYVNATLNGKTVGTLTTIYITTSSSTFSGSALMLILLLGVIAVVVAIVVIVLLLRRKKSPRGPVQQPQYYQQQPQYYPQQGQWAPPTGPAGGQAPPQGGAPPPAYPPPPPPPPQ